jgi:hypothetical protein
VDINKIVKTVKKTILEQGGHHPTIIVEFEDEQDAIVLFDDMPTDGHKRHMMFFTSGRKVGAEIKLEVRDLCFVSEAWLSRATEGGQPKYDRPSLDPNKKEAIIISRIQIMPGPDKPQMLQSLTSYEMLRDGSGELVDLLKYAEFKDRDVNNSLLTYFLSGIASAEYSDEQLMDMLAQMGK